MVLVWNSPINTFHSMPYFVLRYNWHFVPSAKLNYIIMYSTDLAVKLCSILFAPTLVNHHLYNIDNPVHTHIAVSTWLRSTIGNY